DAIHLFFFSCRRRHTSFSRYWSSDVCSSDLAILEAARNQAHIDRRIGTDVSVAWIWRPFFTQNIVFRLSGAGLVPDDGFTDLYRSEERRVGIECMSLCEMNFDYK